MRTSGTNLDSFRHTYATTALTEGGVDVVTLSHLLEHRDSANCRACRATS